MRITDSVFGEMIYDHSWEKDETIIVSGKEQPIKVVVAAYEGQGILDIQREQYLNYQEGNAIEKIPGVLLRYYIDNYDSIAENMVIPDRIKKDNIDELFIMNLIRINAVYFARNGRYGFLCDCAWDEEHGLCIVLSDGEPRIEEQDYLI